MAERAIINIDVLTDEDDVEELREELEDAEDQAGETAESVGDVGSEAVESERSVRSLGRSLRRLDGTDVNVNVDTGSTGGMGRRGRRRLPGELDEVQRSLEIIGSLRPELLATAGAVTTLTGSLAAAGGLSAAALVAANETGVLTEEIKNLKGEGKATARSFAQEFKPVLEGDVIPALSRLLTIIEGASDELATFTGSVFDLLRKLKGTPGPVGLLSTIFVPSEEEGTPGPADRIENVIRKVERKLEDARDRFATMRVFGIGEKKIIEDRISTLEELRKKLIKTRASVDLKDAPDKWRTLDALTQNVQQSLEEARQASESFDQGQQLSLLERQQEKVSELRRRVKMLSGVEAQRLAQTRQTKEELKQETEALREHNRLMATGFDQTQEQRRREAAQAGLDALGEATMPDPEEAESKFDQLASHLGQAVKAKRLGFDGVGNQIGQQLIQSARQALIEGEISEEEFQNFKKAAEDAGIELEEQVGSGISAGAQAGVQTLSALMSTAISEITRDIENKWARAITNAAAQALSSEAVQRLRDVLSGASAAGGAGAAGAASAAGGAGGLGILLAGAAANRMFAGLTGDPEGPLENILATVLGPMGGLFGAFAEGGEVRGKGGTTEDRIPAMLSDKEFVVQAASAQMAPSALKAINEDPALAGMIEQLIAKPPEQFATGGFVTTPVAGTAMAGGRTLIGEGDREMPALPQGPRAAYGAETQQTLDQAKPVSGELQIQLETEVKRINKRELALLVRTENERRKRFQI
jgi:hypothetical protein